MSPIFRIYSILIPFALNAACKSPAAGGLASPPPNCLDDPVDLGAAGLAGATGGAPGLAGAAGAMGLAGAVGRAPGAGGAGARPGAGGAGGRAPLGTAGLPGMEGFEGMEGLRPGLGATTGGLGPGFGAGPLPVEQARVVSKGVPMEDSHKCRAPRLDPGRLPAGVLAFELLGVEAPPLACPSAAALLAARMAASPPELPIPGITDTGAELESA